VGRNTLAAKGFAATSNSRGEKKEENLSVWYGLKGKEKRAGKKKCQEQNRGMRKHGTVSSQQVARPEKGTKKEGGRKREGRSDTSVWD